jgi:hypothetical protein
VPSGCSAATAVVASLQRLPVLEHHFSDATTAVALALNAARSSYHAVEAGHGALSAARFRRSERLLASARTSLSSARDALISALDALHCSFSRDTSQAAEPATWRMLSDSWWEEHSLGLRCRFASIVDALEGVLLSQLGPSDALDYVACIRVFQTSLSPANTAIIETKKWSQEWATLATTVASGVVGEFKVYDVYPVSARFD